MSIVCTCISLVCHSYVTRMYSYVICMSLVCHPYVTRMYSYVFRVSLVCSRMVSVRHSYVLVCRSYVLTRMLFYHEPTYKLTLTYTLIQPSLL